MSVSPAPGPLPGTDTPPARALPFGEFVALVALMVATVAFSTDAMLPLLIDIGTDLSPADPGRVQLVVTVFMLGLGFGTFLAGPISDRFGRKPVILAGIALYMVAASVAAVTTSLEMLLVARFVQGLGAASPRVVTQALVRDLYAGRHMARVMSIAMSIFVLVPAVAPLLGAQIGGFFGWRAIFWSFLVFGLVSGTWFMLRQPETLPPSRRRALNARDLGVALRDVLGRAQVRLYLVALAFAFAPLLAWIATVSLVFEVTYGRGSEFPLWFAMVALLSAPAGLLNARLVLRMGMRRLAGVALSVQASASGVMLVLVLAGPGGGAGFAIFVVYMLVQFVTVAMIFGNLNALALEPLGHVAGMGASVLGGLSTIGAAVLGTLIARAFDGTPLALTLGGLACSLAALVCLRRADRRD